MIRMRTLAGFIRKEFIQIFRDPKMMVALFFVPLVQLVMFGLTLTSEVKNIEFVVLSKPSQLARDIQSRALASGWFKEVKGIDVSNMADPSQLLLTRRAEAVLVAPPEGFEKALEHGDKPIQILVNATNAQRAQQVDGYIKQLLAAAAASAGYSVAPPVLIQLDMRVLFNHYMNTTDFMIPALLVMSTYIVMLVVGGMSLAKEKEAGTMEKLIASPCSVAEILLGKTLPYFMVGLCIMAMMLLIGDFGFGTPFRGEVWQLLVNGGIFVVSALSLATLLSTIVNTQQQAMMGSILIIMPGILLSGIFFPVANIPSLFRWICYFNPMMYAVVNFRNIILKGGDYAFFWQYCFISALIAAVLGFFAYKNFKSTLN